MRIVLVFLACLLAAPFPARAQEAPCDALEVLAATTPAPPRTPSTWRRHLALLRDMRPGTDVVMIGDSITQGWPPDLLRGLFENKTVLNYGVAGDRVQNILWRLDAAELRAIHPPRVFLLAGTNNLGAHAACGILAGIEAIVAKIRTLWAGTAISIIQILPRGADLKALEAQRQAVAAGIRRLAAASADIAVIDADAAMRCADGKGCGNYADDGLHLSRSGYQALGSALSRRP